MLSLILLVFGFVLFVLAGLGIPAQSPPSRFNLVSFGLACWILAEILVARRVESILTRLYPAKSFEIKVNVMHVIGSGFVKTCYEPSCTPSWGFSLLSDLSVGGIVENVGSKPGLVSGTWSANC